MKSESPVILAPACGVYAASPSAHSEASGTPHSALRTPHSGFTLVEMLVVIPIMGLLAGLIVSLAGISSSNRIKSRARIEVDNLALAIDTYKAKKGVYPPDNPSLPYGPCTNQLFYELWGMLANSTGTYFTNTFNASASGSGLETINSTLLAQFFGTPGIVNSSADTNEVLNFIHTLNAAEIQNINTAANPVWVFATPSKGPTTGLPKASITGNQPVNVIRYVSSSPTNNASTYDLWVDVLVGGKTNRISNWSKDPQLVY